MLPENYITFIVYDLVNTNNQWCVNQLVITNSLRVINRTDPEIVLLIHSLPPVTADTTDYLQYYMGLAYKKMSDYFKAKHTDNAQKQRI